MSSTILITGGAGFIGSHTSLVLLQAYGQACGRELPSQVVDRREGDASRSVADRQLAQWLLG